MEGTEEAERYHRMHPGGWKQSGAGGGFDTGSTPAHRAAMTGDVDSLKQLAITNKEYFTAKDSNGWQPIHEASRGGHREAVELLLKVSVIRCSEAIFDWAPHFYSRFTYHNLTVHRDPKKNRRERT